MSRLALISGDSNYQRHRNCQYVHRTMAEDVLGRPLTTNERVHHVDENKSNNTPSNLVICPDEAYHRLLHVRQRVVDAGGDPNKDKWCGYHKCLHLKTEFSTSPRHFDGLHTTCRAGTNEYRKAKGLNINKFNWKARLDQQYRRLFSKHTEDNICQL